MHMNENYNVRCKGTCISKDEMLCIMKFDFIEENEKNLNVMSDFPITYVVKNVMCR